MLLREWAAAKFPQYHLWEQVRLGPTEAHVAGIVLTPALEAMMRVDNWYCDGVIILPHEVLIIEAKMDPNPGAVGQAMFYLELGFSTPLLESSRNLPMVPVVLFSEDDYGVRRWAQKWGCRVEVYTPSWYPDWLNQVKLRNRSTAPSIAPMGSQGA